MSLSFTGNFYKMDGVSDKVANPLTAKFQASALDASLLTGGEVAKLELAKLIFGLSYQI